MSYFWWLFVAVNNKLKQEVIPSADEIVREDDKPSTDLLKFLAQCTASTSSGGTADGLVMSMQSPASVSNQHKKERGQFVCKMAEAFGTIFDSHSRSYQVNAERNQVWKQIADMTNDKYGSELGDLTVEQTKKLYANYKRKCQLMAYNAMNTTRFECGGVIAGNNHDLDSDASSCNSDILTRLVIPNGCAANPNRIGSPNTLPRMNTRERTSKLNADGKNVFVPNGTSIAQRIVTNSAISTVELLAIIADRDAEIKQLRNELLQKSVEHQLQIARVIEKVADLVKSAVNSNVQREIMSAMSGVTSFTCNENLAEKAYEEEAEL